MGVGGKTGRQWWGADGRKGEVVECRWVRGWWSADGDRGRGEVTKQEDEQWNEVCYTNEGGC